ncbi:LOW QUALITY PROTEIN: hypothetical protein ACHAW6_006450 [Cyclotella cf. meneghiniana]
MQLLMTPNDQHKCHITQQSCQCSSTEKQHSKAIVVANKQLTDRVTKLQEDNANLLSIILWQQALHSLPHPKAQQPDGTPKDTVTPMVTKFTLGTTEKLVVTKSLDIKTMPLTKI